MAGRGIGGLMLIALQRSCCRYKKAGYDPALFDTRLMLFADFGIRVNYDTMLVDSK